MGIMPRIDVTKNFIRERQISPNKCAKRSFRTKAVSKNTRLIVCCPKGYYSKNRCRSGMILQSKLTRRKRE